MTENRGWFESSRGDIDCSYGSQSPKLAGGSQPRQNLNPRSDRRNQRHGRKPGQDMVLKAGADEFLPRHSTADAIRGQGHPWSAMRLSSTLVQHPHETRVHQDHRSGSGHREQSGISEGIVLVSDAHHRRRVCETG
jgi:hypothetical protein